MNSSFSEKGPVVGCCEYSNGISGSMRVTEFLGCLGGVSEGKPMSHEVTLRYYLDLILLSLIFVYFSEYVF
jgi:hypothetical protein